MRRMENLNKYSENASWIEVSARALENNLQMFSDLAKTQFGIGVVLKGNAYGHGLENILSVIHSRVDCAYVISPQDAFWIRKWEQAQGRRPIRIVVIGTMGLSEALECTRQKIEWVIADSSWKEWVDAFRKARLVAQVHIHLDTGLSREGFPADSAAIALADLKASQDVMHVRGIMSHFSNTEDVTEQSYAHSQVKAFRESANQLKKLLGLDERVEEHLSASAAAMVLPEARLSRVRIGISLYGFWPSVETRISAKLVLKSLPHLEPVLTWKCRSQIVKNVKKGTFVGYGCTYRCEKDTWVAVFPVGYFDGYPRLVSGKAYVLIDGTRCPVIGRVMMNHIIVDVSQVIASKELDQELGPLEAVLIGTSKSETLPAETVASWANTIQYEVVSRLGAHLRREVVA